MEFGLGDGVYLVTGGSSGIGLACAQILVEEGADVIVIGRRRERLEAAVEACSGGPGAADSLSLDITSPTAGDELLAFAGMGGGNVAGLVNCAGSMRARPLEEIPDSEWEEQWELNVMAPKRLMDALAPALAANGGGSIVNVCSSAGRRPSARNAAYAVAKRGQLALTEVYAQRLGPSGIRVNAVAPGPAETPLWLAPGGLLDEIGEAVGSSREEALAAAADALPLGRLASAAEIAAAIVAMLAPTNPANGAIWSVDGGHVPDVF
jgi:NAD(P)-dependent dehydrogenase (short-subunit alcohol dehydrogenase family)